MSKRNAKSSPPESVSDFTTDRFRIDLLDPELYTNRELSWLEFNRRVLEEAQDQEVPLLERLKFLAIFSSNLDEFFMVRVAGVKELLLAGFQSTGPDGLAPLEQLRAIRTTVSELVNAQYRCLQDQVRPQLKQEGIVVLRIDELSASRREWLQQYYYDEIAPVLTPLAIDPAHPFPYLGNATLNLAIVFEHDDDEIQDTGLPYESAFALIQVPSVLPRLIPVKSHNYSQAYVLLEDVISTFCNSMFVGLTVRSAHPFRVTRNSDFVIDEDDIENLLLTIDRELRNRERRNVVRLEFGAHMPQETRSMLMEKLDVYEYDMYAIDGPLDLGCLWTIYKSTDRRHLKDPPFNPRISPELGTHNDIFSVLRERDILLHHPFESFSSVVELLQSAAEDPNVLAMKQTLYRTAGDSPIIDALIKAAAAGKQVTALVELRARFDELNNIQWARKLESAGVHVVYGILGLKTHCKASMVVRRDPQGIRRYVHLGTGNYNSSTAKLYTDLGFMTGDEEIGKDVATLFNLLTGFNYVTGSRLLHSETPELPWRRILVAPINLHSSTQKLIEDEITHAKAGRKAKIIAKMNSLVDPMTIHNLYRASQAGVKIDLIVRGICCLRAGIPGVSENIRVISIIDRFLEHSRIFYFYADGEELTLMGSADWMPRNFFRRVEAVFPVRTPEHKARVLDLLNIQLRDNVKARVAQPTGPYLRRERKEGEARVCSQERFIEIAREVAIKSDPYEESLRNPREARLAKPKRRH